MRPQASIIILTYNSERYVDACLASVLRQPARPSHEVIVVDNASTDGTRARLEAYGGRITVLANQRNLLSTRGLNPAIRAARGAIIVLLDVDTEVEAGWLAELVRPIQKDPSVAVTGSKLLYPDGTIQHAGGATAGNAIATHAGHGERDRGQWDAPREVEYVTGASTAIRRSFLEKIGGGLDETFPFYFEDADLCHQAWRLGYRVVYAPASGAVHHESVGMKLGSPRYVFNFHRGRCRFLLKNRPLRYLLGQAPLAELRWLRRGRPRGMLPSVLRAYLSALPALPRIVRSRLALRRLARPARAGPMRACVMASSLFLRANGTLSCWCDAGKDLTLATLSEEALRTPGLEVLALPALRHIRRAFMQGTPPYPDPCGRCVMLGNRISAERSETCRFMTTLHVEPSILCQIDCADCRIDLATGPKQLPLPLFQALLGNLRASGVEEIGTIHFEGLGEPLINPRFPDMVEAAREAFPDARIMVTTNGNFRWSERHARLPIDHLRVSIDGVDQATYARYREGGELALALRFLAAAADNRRRTGFPREVEWKYILFHWNDSDDAIRRAAEMSREIGVHATFDMSFAADVTRRFTPDTLDAKLREVAPWTVNISRVRKGAAAARAS